MTENPRPNPFRLLAEAFRVVVIDDLAGGVLNLKPLSPALRWLGRLGLLLVAGLVVLTLLFYAQRGQLTRNWIDVPMTVQQTSADSLAGADQAAAPGAASLALSFAGPIGLPPAALPLCLAAIALGWGLTLAGARRSSPLVYYPLLLLYAAQLGLMAGLVANPLAWGALGLLLAIMAGLYWLRRQSSPTWLWLEAPVYAGLSGLFFLALFLIGGGRQWLSAGLVASQVVMLFILTGFWLLLGSDTVDAAVSVGRWLAGLIARGLSLRTARWLIPLLLLGKVVLTLLFAPPLLADAVVTGLLLLGIIVLAARRRYDEGSIVLVSAIAVISTVIVYYAALGLGSSAVVEATLFAIPPVVSFAVFVVWDMLGRGADFADDDTPTLPRPARLLLLLGWVTLATTTMLFFFAARDDAFEAFANHVAAEAVLVSGLPFALYLLINKAPTLLHGKKPVSPTTGEKEQYPLGYDRSQELTGLFLDEERELDEIPNRVPAWAFALLALAIAVGLGLTQGLTTVQFAQAAVLTNRADLLAEQQPAEAERLYRDALAAFPAYYKGHFNLGTFFYQEGRHEEAIPEFEAAIAANAEYVQAYVNLGVALSSTGRPDEAEQVYLQALEVDEKLSYAHNNLGLIYMRRGDWEQALGYLEQALAYATEERVEFYNNLGQAEWETGQWADAETHLLKAVELAPDDGDYYVTLGLLYNTWGTEAALAGEWDLVDERYEKARAAYEAALEREADAFLIGTNLSQLYLDLGELERAEEVVQQALDSYPDDANLHHILGIILHRAGRPAEARTAFRTAKELDPDYPYAWAGEALLDLQRKDYATAAAGYEQALRLDLDRDYVRYNLGLCYLSLHRTEEAIEQFDLVIEQFPSYADKARRQKAIALVELGRDEEALALWEDAAEGAIAADYVSLGQAYYFRGDLEAAEYYYQQAIDMDPNDPAAYTELGLVYDDLGRTEEAIALHRQAIAVDPSAPEPYVNLGSALALSGDIAGGEEAYRQAIELDPSLPEAHVGLGEILAHNGDTAGAQAEFEAALALDPNQPIANFRLGLIYYYAEEYETAIPYFETAIAADPFYINPYAFLGLCHGNMGDTEQAIAAFEGGLAVCGDPETCALFEQAIEDLKK